MGLFPGVNWQDLQKQKTTTATADTAALPPIEDIGAPASADFPVTLPPETVTPPPTTATADTAALPPIEDIGAPASADFPVTPPPPPPGEVPPEAVLPPGADPNDQLYQDLMASHKESWQNQEDIARAQAARGQRRAAEMAAGMGAATGGGTFASGQAQAGLKGQELMMNARRQHDIRGLELQMTNLVNKLKVAEAAEDRVLTEKIQNMINETALLIESMRHPPAVDPESGAGGGGGAGSFGDWSTGDTVKKSAILELLIGSAGGVGVGSTIGALGSKGKDVWDKIKFWD
jgi:hypothetical protein